MYDNITLHYNKKVPFENIMVDYFLVLWNYINNFIDIMNL